MNKNILVIDDEKELADLVETYLKSGGCNTYKCYSGIDALKCIGTAGLGLAILDIMLPDIDDFRICQKTWGRFHFPVTMLTAKVEDGDKIMGLFTTDDYITKPFNLLKVVAGIKAQLRQYMRYKQPCTKREAGRTEYDIRGTIIGRSNHKCILLGKEVRPTSTEFSILWYLCERQGTAISAEELFEAAWDGRYSGSDNTVMAYAGRLREKMREPSRSPKFIKTVWGVGYTTER